MGRYLEMAMRVPPQKAVAFSQTSADPATKATKATEAPLLPVIDASKLLDGGRRDYCRDLAPLYDWPRCEITPGITILAGEANWFRFLAKADDTEVLAAIRALWQLDREAKSDLPLSQE